MRSRSSRRSSQRLQALTVAGAVHPHPDSVVDPLFRDSAFFDPNDLLQVKYEMLRSVQVAARPVVEVAAAFGFSRPVFYVAQAVFARDGLPGLLPHKRGPKQPHKLTDEVLETLAAVVREAGTMPSAEELALLLADRCAIEAHPRTIVRRLMPYLQRREKKLP